MRNIFSPDSFLIKTLNLFCDLMFLNFLFLICSLPIFTIGASLTALYSVCFKRMKKNDLPIFKTFFAEFRSNFKQATLFWIIYMVIVGVLGASVLISHSVLDEAYSFLQYPSSILLFLIVFSTVLVLPQVALFDSSLKQDIKNSVLLSLTNFPIVGMVLIICIFIFLIADLNAKARMIVISLFLFFLFAALAYFFCIFFRRIFEKTLERTGQSLDPEDEEDPDESES
ncbi:MAG: YesL family protein [Lachnospiraceae bacterium]|nr:YesL family protein [Lachnospiraceae bacterium]